MAEVILISWLKTSKYNRVGIMHKQDGWVSQSAQTLLLFPTQLRCCPREGSTPDRHSIYEG